MDTHAGILGVRMDISGGDKERLGSTMTALGDRLKEARLKQGLSLKEIAERTRIQVHFLEALEGNNPEVIPGAFFRKSFLRQYATFLGLNPDEFSLDNSVQFGSSSAADEVARSGSFIHAPLDLPPLPTPGKTREFPLRQIMLSLGLLIGVIAVCAVAYTFWEDFQNTSAAPEAEMPASQAQQVAPPLPEETLADSAGEALSESSTPANSAPNGMSEAQQAESAVSEPPATAGDSSEPESSPPPDPTAQPAPATTVHGSGARELRLSADALTWVRVKEGDRTLFVGTIEAGQTRVVRVAEQAQILTGNAGSLKVFWQGKDLGSIGPVGQIRTVVVTPEESTIQAPAPRSPAPASGAPGSARRG